ncbi:MAG: sodium-dependent transporter [Eubacteriales bacterium]|nr:sodium-dependent transporter [Eubacteriales bacterium]
MKQKQRSNFSSKIGFVLAAAGSAVGLGNIWRFPYLAAEYGGGTFLLVYLILAVTFGFAMMVSEIAIGRRTGLSAIAAFSSLDKRFRFLGILTTLVPVLILPYYSVIGGWVVKYFVVFLSGQGLAASDDAFFNGFISQTGQPLLWFLVFLLLTSVVVILGVEKGIEKVSTVLMPLLVLLSVVIAVFAITRPGSGEGVLYYLRPDLSKLTGKTVLAALGQLFYSMSLAMGIMITYGSYMKKTDNLEKSVRQIEIFDTAIAFLAGLMIVPAVFTFSGGDESAMSAGPGLMFITLPKVFDSMPGGMVIGTLFFLLVFFAALTSSISLMETIVSILQDRLHWNRRLSTVIVTLFCVAVGIPSSLGFGIWSGVTPLGMSILDFFDFTSNSVLMPIVAFLTCVFVGFVIKPQAVIDEVEEHGVSFKAKRIYAFMIKYLAPIGIIAILISSIAAGLGWLTW